ncbi:MAG: Mn2+/Fe2+ NRAMP family transporter [Akkermansiaceae bacterium]|jgi:Mn2+/Fe2+ NRAMP family transporter
MSDKDQYQRELDVIDEVKDKGPIGKFFGYAKISGPGWLQGAITLGGGSLIGALYLGTISGNGLLWVQPLAMICGIIMLSAIAYVTLSTGQRPLRLINEHLNPLLGWSWLVATIMANIVWTMPQFSLGTAAIQQNLIGITDPDALKTSQWFIIAALFGVGLYVNYLYQAGGGGAKLFDRIIKAMVAIIVLSFVAVVVSLAGTLPWGEVLTGYLPNFSLLTTPAEAYQPFIEKSSNPEWWQSKVLGTQKDVIFTAFGTAVGINMTFLLPYTLLKKRWGTKHRGLSIIDLSIGLFVPFFLATSCVVIAAAASFHGKVDMEKLTIGDKTMLDVPAIKKSLSEFKGIDEEKVAFQKTTLAEFNENDRIMAAMLVKRDAGALAGTLEPFTGRVVAQKVFGVGVLGMAISTIIILMLINGLAFQEIFAGKKSAHQDSATALSRKMPYYLGCLVSGLVGCSFPFIWNDSSAKAALAVPTSVIGGALLPIAYFTFLLMMNSKKILGDKRPKGTSRIIWNVLMVFSTIVASAGSVWVLYGKGQSKDWFASWEGTIPAVGLIFLAVLVVAGTTSFIMKEKKA